MADWCRPGWQVFLLAADCDVWLLTEVDDRIELDGYARHLPAEPMAKALSPALVAYGGLAEAVRLAATGIEET